MGSEIIQISLLIAIENNSETLIIEVDQYNSGQGGNIFQVYRRKGKRKLNWGTSRNS